MQKSRRPHGTRTRKVSISVSEADLAILTARARQVHRGNVSAVVHDLVGNLERAAALDRLLGVLGGDPTPTATLDRLRKEIANAPIGRLKRRPAA